MGKMKMTWTEMKKNAQDYVMWHWQGMVDGLCAIKEIKGKQVEEEEEEEEEEEQEEQEEEQKQEQVQEQEEDEESAWVYS